MFGWDKILIQNLKKSKTKIKNKLAVILGGTDIYNFGKILPNYLDKNIKLKGRKIWIQGPFARKPFIKKKNSWLVIKGSKNIHRHILESEFVIVLFGVSFFEVVSLSKPNVVMIPYQKEKAGLIKELKNKKFSVASNFKQLSKKILFYIQNKKALKLLATKHSKLLKNNKRKFLYKRIFKI
jgi:spore coat polysaccharide biosynthesis predicted glycosyltransferase SpsG